MNNSDTKNILKYILEHFGPGVICNVKQLRAALLDFHVNKKELNLITTILQSNAFADILDKDRHMTDYDKKRLLKDIQNEYPFEEAYLKMGLDWWFYALSDVKTADAGILDDAETVKRNTADDYFNNESYEEAFDLFSELAGDGDDYAENKLGVMYMHGYGVDKDYEEALHHFLEASKVANHDAQYNLGVMFQFGYGVPFDAAKAYELYQKAAQNGNTKALTSLGLMYEKGIYAEKNYYKAARFYFKAAEKGDSEAQTNLAWLYCEGKGVSKDYAKAFKWYQEAAKQNDRSAQKSLGWMYENGYGVMRSYNEALKWYRKANEN